MRCFRSERKKIKRDVGDADAYAADKPNERKRRSFAIVAGDWFLTTVVESVYSAIFVLTMNEVRGDAERCYYYVYVYLRQKRLKNVETREMQLYVHRAHFQEQRKLGSVQRG